MAESEPVFDAFAPIRFPDGTMRRPVAPRQPNFFEQREISERAVARLLRGAGRAATRPVIEDADEYHSGVEFDDDDFYIRYHQGE